MVADPFAKSAENVGEPSQADLAYEALKQDILTCVIEPKRRLTEIELTNHYDFGRAAVRNALIRLNQEALVDVLPRYGYVVAGYDELGTRDLFQLQLLLEPTAGRLAAGRVDGKLLVDLDAACEETQLLPGVEGAVQFLRANTSFHVAVAQASGNALLARFVRILYERLDRLLYASGRIEQIVQDVFHDHNNIVEHLILGQGELAEDSIRQRLELSHGVMINHLRHLSK